MFFLLAFYIKIFLIEQVTINVCTFKKIDIYSQN